MGFNPLHHLRGAFTISVFTLNVVFWFIPIVIVGLAKLLGPQGEAVDDPAFATLGAIASGMLVFIGFVFSVVTFAIQYEASTYTPRLLRAIADSAAMIDHAARNSAATYPPITGPQSSGPSSATVSGNGRVNNNATATSASPAINLPSTSCSGLIGLVSRLSRVPERRSSDQARMVKAATRKISSTGIHWKSGRTSAMLRAK